MIEIRKAKSLNNKDVLYILKHDKLLVELTHYHCGFYSLHEVVQAINSKIKWIKAIDFVDIAKLKEQNNFKIMFEFESLSDINKLESTHPEFFYIKS